MCGIAGILSSAGQKVFAQDIRLLSNGMEHRGPDDLGYMGWVRGERPRVSRICEEVVQNPDVAFAHRRLSIIDEGGGGWQPMSTEDGRYVLAFNGEIYNYIELKKELEGEGIGFTTHSDTEVLLQALVVWGVERALLRLMGMFAFALLDTQSNTVTLARDPFGIKPLSYTEIKGSLVFASEITQLLPLSKRQETVEASALFDYLRFGFTDRGSKTLFTDIKHLPAAHYASINLDAPARVHPVRYWQPELKPTLDIGFEEAANELRNIFMESVSLHLRSDVPVGAALSGGIDSSAVVGAMRELGGSALDLNTFTFIAPNSHVNEEKWADLAAKHVRATQHKISLTGQDLADKLDDLIVTQGEPFGTTSIFAQNQVFKLAADHGIKVTLDGQGADEMIGGYVPFFAARFATMVRSGQLLRGAKFLHSLEGNLAVAARSMRFILPLGLQVPMRKMIGEDLVPNWMNGEWFRERGVVSQAPQKPVSGDVLRQEMLQSLTDRILPALLRVQDRNSMAHSVESRVPFLTTKMVDFLYSLPEEYLISDAGETKSVFRRAAQGLAPERVLQRRDKIGFATPEEVWLKDVQPWVNDVMSGSLLREMPVFEPAVMEREIARVKNGQKRLTGEVWRWVNLSKWADRFSVQFS